MMNLNILPEVFDFWSFFSYLLKAVVDIRRDFRTFVFEHNIDLGAKSNNPYVYLLALEFHSFDLISNSLFDSFESCFSLKDSIHASTDVNTI